jgi:medium-chain acyl-[acyl-carrier-protein] hydrolase
MTKLYHTFPATAVDYFGYVTPKAMMQEINEGIAVANFADGVGFAHIFPTIGVTWMLGQCVMEFEELIPCAHEVEIESFGHEQFGIATVRRAVMRREGREAMRIAVKLLPVDFTARKAVPASTLDPFWKTPPIPCGEKITFLQMPEEMETKEVYRVSYRDCDSNKHMTAFRYLDLIMETIGYWDGEIHMPRRIQIDYLRECLPGESLLLRYAEKDGIRYCAGIKEDGTASFHATVKLSEEVYPAASVTNV